MQLVQTLIGLVLGFMLLGAIYAFFVFGFAMVLTILMFGIPTLIAVVILSSIWDALKKKFR